VSAHACQYCNNMHKVCPCCLSPATDGFSETLVPRPDGCSIGTCRNGRIVATTTIARLRVPRAGSTAPAIALWLGCPSAVTPVCATPRALFLGVAALPLPRIERGPDRRPRGRTEPLAPIARGQKETGPAGLTRFQTSNVWRRGRDSNPRTTCAVSGFQDRCIQPLCHPSGG
jgi:hypothetical protein